MITLSNDLSGEPPKEQLQGDKTVKVRGFNDEEESNAVEDQEREQKRPRSFKTRKRR